MASSSSLFAPTRRLALPLAFLTTLYQIPTTSAYSWSFQNDPKQCSNLTVSISGSDGVPPYRILILPIGSSPLKNNIEARKIMDVKFDGDSTSVDFLLKYPADSQLVAVSSLLAQEHGFQNPVNNMHHIILVLGNGEIWPLSRSRSFHPRYVDQLSIYHLSPSLWKSPSSSTAGRSTQRKYDARLIATCIRKLRHRCCLSPCGAHSATSSNQGMLSPNLVFFKPPKRGFKHAFSRSWTTDFRPLFFAHQRQRKTNNSGTELWLDFDYARFRREAIVNLSRGHLHHAVPILSSQKQEDWYQFISIVCAWLSLATWNPRLSFDSTKFGSGGTSVAAKVADSSDSSCFSSDTNVSPDFVFSIEPPNQVVQCQNMRLWWDPATVQGTPNFLGVIPGGQSFAIPQGQITTVPSQGTGFTWKPNVRGGTTLLIVGGDNRGNGTAGSTFNVVSSGINNDGSCLSDSSPSSTPGSPAGGSYPTGSDGTRIGGGGGSSNTGAIVGGVIGGLIALIAIVLIIWFLRKKQKTQKRFKERPVDLMNADDDDGDESAPSGRPRTNELPQYYQPEPFMVPDPTINGSIAETSDDPESRRPLSGTASSFYTRDTRATSPDPTASLLGFGMTAGSSTGQERRKGVPRPMRAVNVIQHDDAGPSLPMEDKDGEDEPETIELPPAYTAVKRNAEGTSPPAEPAH
ncbi:hypothetical protein JR316_0007710 [Psilocybe cubensis]|uniref:Uncharacterized protein n=2 Tax=Psilocybe cubensis TaxID=181762 RepID=A0ACB8GU76_PSICU|nr:hypothetical protein JR316_0007710 [Psilocybe cubensis]KAH9479131.1 hypothetical protein JR316_0007710 [Psilocybe cubensis]